VFSVNFVDFFDFNESPDWADADLPVVYGRAVEAPQTTPPYIEDTEMSLTTKWSVGILLGSMALWVASGNVRAQTWHAAGETATPVSWQQRVLKRPTSLQRSAMQPAADAHEITQRPTYRRGPFQTVSTQAATPSGEGGDWINGAEVIPPGVEQFEPLGTGGVFTEPGGYANCGGPGEGCAGCASCGEQVCGGCCDFGYECFDGRCGRWLRDLSFFVGGHGFKGPTDRGTNGNFGLHEGLNLAGPLGDPWGCGYQVGFNVVHSDFSGAPTITLRDQQVLRASDRNQCFLTGAIFRRAICNGFQGGVAVDYLHDSYYQNTDLLQLRNEISYVFDGFCEVGYFGAYGVGTDHIADGRLDPIDMFCFYTQRSFENGGDGRLWAGFSGNGDGLFGASLWVPLGRSFALENRINYLLPRQGDTAQEREAWGITMQLVWYPGKRAMLQQGNPYRAMFGVADNSSFMVDRLTD